MAAALVHHEPGWRLPRPSALARRYNVGIAAVGSALDELTARHLVRRLPDGQVYRASPAEYFIALEGVTGLTTYVDPMGGQITCRSRQVSWQRVPEDIGHALGIDAGGSVRVLRLLWTANGEPAAVSTTYLAAGAVLTTLGPGDAPSADTELTVAPVAVGPEANQDGEGSRQRAWQPRALIVEMQQPPNSVARKLGVPVGQPAVMVMVRFDDPELERPAAVTISVLRPELFRIVVESPASPQSESSDGQTSDAWAHALEDWNP